MSARRDNDFLDLVYDAALEPALWATVLERFADMTGGAGGWISQLDMVDGTGADEGDPLARVDPSFASRYIEHFALRNPLSNVDNPGEYMRRWTPKILTDEDWIPKGDLLKTEFYNDFLRPQDIHSGLMVRLAARGHEIATLNLGRPERRGQFSQSDIEIAAWHHPHLIRAFELGRKFAATRRLSGDMASVLDHSPHGVFLLDESGRIRHANRMAETLLAEAGGLTLIRGRLGASTPDAARRLHALICAAGSLDREKRTGASMALPTPARRLPLSLTIAPVRPDRFAPLHSGPSVVVCVTDLEAEVSLPEQRLRDLFGLTPAETRVALALFDGLSPADAATGLGVSFHTVRNQLVRIFEKTGTNRQTELVRLMMRAVGADPP
jgi:DNA-binding CsgD family transcriptional regulator/PAS domain-containing protein